MPTDGRSGLHQGMEMREKDHRKEVVHGGEMSKQSAGERDGESNEDKFETRIMKLEEQTKWMLMIG